MVIYETDGTENYERFIAIDEAVAMVERLRNSGNGSARIYRMEEIQFEVKAYYRVEVGSAPAPAVAVPTEPAFDQPEHTQTVESTEPVEAVEAAEPVQPLEEELEPMTVEVAVPDFEAAETYEHATDADPSADHEEFAVTSSLGGARRGLFGR